MTTKTKRKAKAAKVLAENDKIINASLLIMDQVDSDSDVYTWAEQIRDLADKIEDWADELP